MIHGIMKVSIIVKKKKKKDILADYVFFRQCRYIQKGTPTQKDKQI